MFSRVAVDPPSRLPRGKSMTQDLEGVLVVGLEHAVAAPFCTAQLADAGARVIKVERPEGDFARGYDTVVKGGSAYFVWLNRGKESIALDLRDPADKALLERIVARADVFVQNLGPGQAARLGFGAADLAARHPRLVTCDISGYGEAGPYAGMKAYDLLVQAETGLCSITGAPEAPGRVGISLADVATGATAHGAILRALYRRERTGRGAVLKTSLFDTLADWMSVPLLHQVYGGKAPPRVGIRHPSIAPYGAYALGDGSQIVISIQNEREWVRFCAAILDEPALATNPRFATMTARVAKPRGARRPRRRDVRDHGPRGRGATTQRRRDRLRHAQFRRRLRQPPGAAARPRGHAQRIDRPRRPAGAGRRGGRRARPSASPGRTHPSDPRGVRGIGAEPFSSARPHAPVHRFGSIFLPSRHCRA